MTIFQIIPVDFIWTTCALVKACAYSAFGAIGMVLLAHEEIQGRIRKSECYVEVFKYLHENNGAVKYFGQPIISGYINNIYDSEDESDLVYWYKVPLKGPDGKGILYYKAVKNKKWFLSRSEVELEKLPGRKFLLMEKEEPIEEAPSEEVVYE